HLDEVGSGARQCRPCRAPDSSNGCNWRSPGERGWAAGFFVGHIQLLEVPAARTKGREHAGDRMRETLKAAANRVLSPFGARLVGADWGPRGFAACFRRIKSRGFEPATIIDIGASDGRWTSECMGVFRNSRYALFDALPDNEAAMEALALRSGVTFWRGAL